jgi:hypothetical protein
MGVKLTVSLPLEWTDRPNSPVHLELQQRKKFSRELWLKGYGGAPAQEVYSAVTKGRYGGRPFDVDLDALAEQLTASADEDLTDLEGCRIIASDVYRVLKALREEGYVEFEPLTEEEERELKLP